MSQNKKVMRPQCYKYTEVEETEYFGHSLDLRDQGRRHGHKLNSSQRESFIVIVDRF